MAAHRAVAVRRVREVVPHPAQALATDAAKHAHAGVLEEPVQVAHRHPVGRGDRRRGQVLVTQVLPIQSSTDSRRALREPDRAGASANAASSSSSRMVVQRDAAPAENSPNPLRRPSR
jgi:hypothetical protein